MTRTCSITVNMTDVRNKAGLADYTGQLQVTHGAADHGPRQRVVGGTAGNGAGHRVPGHGSVHDHRVGDDRVHLQRHDDRRRGDPGLGPEAKRTMWELGQVTVNDGGADGLVSTGPNTVFAKQGVFIP